MNKDIKQKVTIVVAGGDDCTYIDTALTREEIKVVKKLCRLSEKNSTCGCMPIVKLEDKS